MAEWQPIETAPKDGTRIDVWYGGERFADCFWSPEDECFGFQGEDFVVPVPDATHWMPIPEGPPGA